MVKWVVPLVLLGVFLTLGAWFGLTFISVSNQDVDLHTLKGAQEKANAINYDKMWKVLKQKAGVTDQYAGAFADVYVKIADARYNDQNLLMKFINEANPTFDASLYKDLSMSIEALQSEFARVQTKLVDIDREHNNMLGKFPTSIFLMIKGDKPFELKIVTSTRTENAFSTGKDDDVQLFDKKPVQDGTSMTKPQSSNSQNAQQNLEKLGKLPAMIMPNPVNTNKTN